MNKVYILFIALFIAVSTQTVVASKDDNKFGKKEVNAHSAGLLYVKENSKAERE